MNKTNNKTMTLTIEGLTSEGESFATINKKLVRVAGFLPGDSVKIDFDEKSNEVINAELVEASPDRIKADCFYHGACGGCDLLELSEKGRKKEKQAMIKRALARIPNADQATLEPFCASKILIKYMPRVRLHQSQSYDERSSGFLAADNYSEKVSGNIVPVTSCALLTQALNKRLVAARKILDTVPIMLESNKEVVLIPCGGEDSVSADREQWSDGSNTIAIAPGKVIAYERNDITNNILRENGIEVFEIPSSELSRGRGGPRCMCMPLEREDI